MKKINKILPDNPVYVILLILMMLVGIGFFAMMTIVNAFPINMIIGFIVVMLGMIALADFLFMRDTKWKRIVGIVVSVIFILIYGLGIYYLITTQTMFSRISVSDASAAAKAKGVNVTEDSYNIYITGIDQWDSEKGYDLERSDVNMIVTVCPKTHKILLTSIPRDSYVPLHSNGAMDKLTHTGVYGVDETLSTVESWLGIEINYYVKANFSAVVDVINAIGGVDVYSDREFSPVKRSWWTVKKGWNHMNGKEALAFARERKAYNEEDSQRVLNQQKVLKAMLDKMTTSTTMLTKYDDIVSAAGNSMETNMPTSDMQALVKMQLADLGKWNIKTQRVSGEYDMDYVASLTHETKFQVYKVKKSEVKKITKKINKTLHPSSAEIAAATASRQKNSILSFIKNLKGNK